MLPHTSNTEKCARSLFLRSPTPSCEMNSAHFWIKRNILGVAPRAGRTRVYLERLDALAAVTPPRYPSLYDHQGRPPLQVSLHLRPPVPQEALVGGARARRRRAPARQGPARSLRSGPPSGRSGPCAL